MYTLSYTENDYLQYQLYTASKSKQGSKRRLFFRWVLTTLFLVLGALFHLSDEPIIGNTFLIASVLGFLVFPYLVRRRLQQFYLNHIKENYAARLNTPSTIEFKGDFVESKGANGEAKLKLSSLVEVNEIAQHIFIKTNTSESLVIPKNQLDYKQFLEELKTATQNLNLHWNKELDWKW
jgi:hypothetical protein